MKNTSSPVKAKQTPNGSAVPSSPRVLIVEDEQIVARDLQIGLTNLGYVVPGTAASGEEALQLIAHDPPDLVLLDIGLGGGMDGIEVGSRIARDFDIPVVFASAYTDEDTLRRARQAVPFGFIVKPFEVRDIRSTIEMAVYKHRLDKERKREEERYRLVFQSSPVGILHFDRHMVVTEVNNRFGNLIGASPEEVLNLPVTRFFDPPVHAALASALRGVPAHYEGISHRLNDREGIWIMLRTAPLTMRNTEISGAVAIVEDLSEHRKVEDALVRRVALENLVAACAARLINASSPKLKLEIEQTLGTVGRFVGADRCFLDLFTPTSSHVDQEIVWTLPDTPPGGFSHQGVSLARWPWAISHLQTGDPVCLHRVADLPDAAGADVAFWADDGAQSLLLFPLTTEQRLFGAFGVVTVREERIWGGEDLRLLALLGEVLAGVLAGDRSHDQLRNSEERFKRIANQITDYMYTVRLEHGHWAETVHGFGCLAVTGYTPEEYVQDPHLWLKMVDERDRGPVLDQVKRLLAGEPAEPLEHRIIRKDGRVRWVRNTPILHFTPYGELSAYDGLMQDITERRESAEALRLSEERYRALVENLHDIVFSLDGKGYFTYMSLRIEPLTGYAPSEIVGQHFTRFVHPHDRQGLQTEWERMLAGQVGSYEFRILTKAGNERMVRTTSSQHTGRDGTIVVTGIMTDCTEKRQMEERLRISEQQFREVLAHVPLGAVILDHQGTILFCNDAALHLAGHGMDDLRGRRWYDVCMGPEQRETARRFLLEQMTQAETSVEFRSEIIRQNGQRLSIPWTVTPFRDDTGRLIGMTCVAREHPVIDSTLNEGERTV